MKKQDRQQKIRDRAENALLDLYHNATPSYPRLNDQESEIFESWFSDYASMEIDWLSNGGAWGDRQSMADYFDKKYKTPKGSAYALRHWIKQRNLERSKYARYEEISDYGNLYTWGRGSRTLAPNDLIRTHGGSSFSINVEPAQEWPISKVVELTLIVEAFNDYVKAWNKDIPRAWAEWAAENPELFSDPLEEDCHA